MPTSPVVHDLGGNSLEDNIFSHFLDELLGGPFLRKLRIQLEFIYYFEELGGAHDPLGDGLQPLLGITGHGRHHQFAGN